VVRVFVVLLPGGQQLATGTDFVMTLLPTDSQGDTTLEFSLVGVGLDQDDRVIFTIDAVYAVDPGDWANEVTVSTGSNTISVPLSSVRRRGQWNFPATGEALTFPSVRLP
jgi:hypothetical protein